MTFKVLSLKVLTWIEIEMSGIWIYQRIYKAAWNRKYQRNISKGGQNTLDVKKCNKS